MYLAYYGILKRSSFDKGVTESNYRKSIAVLPFKNLNDSATNQYFIDGVMEEILTNLSKIHYLRVVSRTSVEQFRSRIMTTSEIAKKLKVAYLLEGSGQKSGNKFCLRIQLIEASKDSHIWAKSYEQEVNETRDIFAIQSEVAQLVASELKATITQEERQLIDKIPTTNLTAYDFCLRAKEANSKDIWPGFNQEAEKRAAALYHKALEYDSTYAQAYTGLAEIVWIRLDRDTSIIDINTFNKYLDSLLVLTDIALSYDDKLAAAYNLRGVYYYYKHSATKSEAEYDKAIRINPNDVGAYWRKITNLYMDVDLVKTLEAIQKITSLSHGSELLGNLRNMADVYNQAGFPEKGDVFSLEALKLDGDSVMYSNKIVDNAAVYLGDYKRAIEYYEKGLLRDSTDAGVLGYLGGLYLRLGKYQESLKYYKKYISLLRSRGQTKPPLESYIGYAYLQNGYRKEADFYFDKIIESLDNPFWRYRNTGGLEIWAEYTLAGIYACRGDKGKAYEHLKMFDQIQSVGLQWVTSIKNEPLFNSIRNEPEFQKIVRNIEARYQTEHERVRKWLEEKGEL
jgi:TolB-like protein/Tfp pilus assembly protein PilF